MNPTSAAPRRTSRRIALAASLALLGLLAAGVLAATQLSSTGHGPPPAHGPPPVQRAIAASAWRRTTIYHSPQSPGYTAWVGAWVMPDGSLMTAFTQATGPVDPRQRQLMPESILERDFGLTEQRSNGSYAYLDPRRDFWGLMQSVIYLRSTDDGRTWRRWRTDPFRALAPQAYTPQADIALPDGVLIRRVSGYDLRNDPTIAHTAVLEQLRFDPATSAIQSGWSRPQVILHDPAVCTYQISRIHQLSDGRLIALGQVWRYASGGRGRCAARAYSDVLLVAVSARAAEQGKWSLGMPYTTRIAPNEWDAAELPHGNLLALFRTQINGEPARLEAILQRHGDGWVMRPPQPLPNLPAFAPSGHPDLLATRQGAILSFSTTGTAYTTDGGSTWAELPFQVNPGFDLRTHYYPYAVQAPDGTIDVFSHNGWDIAYGQFDESITLDQFRLGVPLTASHAVLSRSATRRPTLALDLQAPSRHEIERLQVALPSGLTFNRDAAVLRRGIAVEDGRGSRLDFRLGRSEPAEGRLALELVTPAASLRVRLSPPALVMDPALARAIATGALHALPVVVETTDAHGHQARLPIKVAIS